MKSKRVRQELSSEVPAGEKFPLELVVTTALYFLGERGDKDLWRYPLQRIAAQAAIDFLKLCGKQIESDQVDDARRAYHLKEFETQGWKDDDVIPYKEGIKFITGQKRLDRAQEYYETLVKNVRPEKPLTALELSAALKGHEKQGFLALALPALRYIFDRSRASGQLHLKRRKKIQKAS